MELKLHNKIKDSLKRCGIWEMMMNTKIYTTAELINEFGKNMTPELIDLLNKHVGRIQYYFDQRIIEPCKRE